MASKKSSETLYLIDGSGFIFRAFHALPPMTRPDGTHVNAVYGFCNMLHKLLNELNATHIAVIFDAARKNFRNDIYADYKAHRPAPPPELIPQFALIRDATRAFGLPAVEAPNYEADDLIAAYAKAAEKEKRPVRIVSSDKDLMQLIRPGVEMYDPLKYLPIGPDEVLKKFGVTPDKVIDVQALAGDSTDNVPGVPGIGVKTAAELINTYGDLDNLLKNAGSIKQPKRRELLQKHAKDAQLSKKLVTLDADAPLPMPVAQLMREPDHKEALFAFLREQSFRSLLARLSSETDSATAPVPPPPASAERTGDHAMGDNAAGDHALADRMLDDIKDTGEAPPAKPLANIKQDYECVQGKARLQWWVDAARAAGVIAVDTETDSLTACTANLVGISLAIAPGKACYIPLGHVDAKAAPSDGGFAFEAAAEAPKQVALKDAVNALRDLLADPGVLKVGHNLKYDMQVLGQHGLTIAPYDDTMLLSYTLAAGLHGHGLDELAERHFMHKMISYADVTGSGKSKITFDRVPLDKATEYAAEDADFTLRLWHLLKPQIAQHHVTRVYERIERPLAPVVAKMESTGVRIDPEVLRAQSSGFGKRLQALEEEIHKLAGRPFNVGSPKQMGEVLFTELGLAGGSKGKTGAYSTSVDVLEPLAEEHEIVAKILEWRGIAKLKSTYTDALPEQIDKKTGRVHTSFSLVGAATGRLSSTDPNLQNIPIRTEEGRAIRRAFIADEGHTLLSVDYSQIELRLAAEAAQIKALIQAFHDGVDIHALTASQVFGIPIKELPPERRRAAKAINFGIIYGISGFGLGKQLGIPPGEAAEFIRNYLDRFHELRDWMEETKIFAREHGYVETLFGRRIHISGIKDPNHSRRTGAERAAINAPLQGSAADIMKRAMIRIGPALEEAGLGAKLLLQVHDELVFEVPKKELDATEKLVKTVMQNAAAPAVTLKVPIVADAGHAANWAEAH